MSAPGSASPPIVPARKKPRRRRTIIGLVALGTGLLLCVCLAGLLIFGNSSKNMTATGTSVPLTQAAQAPPVAPTPSAGPAHAAAPVPTVAPTTKPAPTEKPPTVAPTAKPAPTSTPQPTAPAPSAATVNQPTTAPSKAAAAFKTGGLGMTRADWEKVYQKPEKEQSGFFTYANGNYFVGYVDDRLWHLEHSWGDQNAKSREFAEGAATPFLPADGKKVQEYKSTGSGSTVVLYHSDGLAALFAPESFIGGEPGDFVVIYRDITGKVTGFVIGLGNNP